MKERKSSGQGSLYCDQKKSIFC